MRNEWSFSYQDESWVGTRDPRADDNLLAAMVTLTDAFSESWQVENALNLWKDHPLNLVGVYVKVLDADTVELRDKYGQFRNVEMPLAEMKDALHSLLHAMKEWEGVQRAAGVPPTEWTFARSFGPDPR